MEQYIRIPSPYYYLNSPDAIEKLNNHNIV